MHMNAFLNDTYAVSRIDMGVTGKPSRMHTYNITHVIKASRSVYDRFHL